VLFLLGTLVFVLGVLVAAAVHSALFSPANLSTWVWFGAFGLAALGLAVASLVALPRRAARAGTVSQPG
jgi:hypothetical protein